MTVIALWLGHETPATTHLYVEADLTKAILEYKRGTGLVERKEGEEEEEEDEAGTEAAAEDKSEAKAGE